jgi:hypothetical protein
MDVGNANQPWQFSTRSILCVIVVAAVGCAVLRVGNFTDPILGTWVLLVYAFIFTAIRERRRRQSLR